MTTDRFDPTPAAGEDPLRQRVEGLLDAHLDGTLDASGAAELRTLLADPMRRQDLHRYAVLHGGLREAFASAPLGAVDAGRTPPGRTAWWRSGWRPSLIAAGLAGILVYICLAIARVPATPAVAIRTADDGSSLVHREQILTPEPGARLWPGDHFLGPMLIGWDDGTTLSAESGSILELEPGPGIAVRLVEGGMRMDVQPQPMGRPLTVHTRQGTATIVGTSFAMLVTQGHSLLAVEHGAIDFRGADGAPTQRVTAGTQMIASGRGAPGFMPAGSHLGVPLRVVLDPVAERGSGWRGTPVANGVRGVRSGDNGWACSTRPGAGTAGLIAAGPTLRIQATCSVARAAQVGVLIVINDARTGAFLCNRQAIRKVPAGVPSVLEIGWNDLAYATGPVAGPDAALLNQAITTVAVFAWGDDPGLVLQRVELLSGGR